MPGNNATKTPEVATGERVWEDFMKRNGNKWTAFKKREDGDLICLKAVEENSTGEKYKKKKTMRIKFALTSR